MKIFRILYILVLSLIFAILMGPPAPRAHSPVIAPFSGALEAQAQDSIDPLFRKALESKSYPVVENDRALFLYDAGESSHDVEIIGDIAGWEKGIKMSRGRAPGNYFFVLENIPGDARIEYKFRVDGRDVLDPRNPIKTDNGVGGENSCIVMPGYKPLVIRNSGIRGSVRTMLFKSTILGNTRKIHIYTPPGYDAAGSEKYPLLIVHDGTQYLEKVELHRIAENLMDEGRLGKLIIVFVDPLERTKEYACDEGFSRFIVSELIPHIRKAFPQARGDFAVMGASMGGLISFHLAFKYPELFPLVASQSGAFGYKGHAFVDEIRSTGERPRRVYMDVGLYDLKEGEWSLLEANRSTVAQIKEKGYTHSYHEYPGGHNWTCWKDQIPSILEFLFGRAEKEQSNLFPVNRAVESSSLYVFK